MNYLHIWWSNHPISIAVGVLIVSTLVSMYAAELRGLVRLPVKMAAPVIVKFRIRSLMSRMVLLRRLRKDPINLLIYFIPHVLMSSFLGVGLTLVLLDEVTFKIQTPASHMPRGLVLGILAMLIVTGIAFGFISSAVRTALSLRNYEETIRYLDRRLKWWLNKAGVSDPNTDDILRYLAEAS